MITLVEPTIDILPAFNRINYTISSTNANETGFKYVVKVYNDSDELITQAFYDSPANPSEPVEFDVSKFVSVNFQYNNGFYQVATSLSSTNTIRGYYLKCYEYYEVDGSFVIVEASEVESATKYAFAGSLPLLEEDNWAADLDKYTGESLSVYKPLTDWVTTTFTDRGSIKMRETDSQIFAFINKGYLDEIRLEVQYFNGTLQNYTITPSAPSVTPCITYVKITPMDYGPNVKRIYLYVGWRLPMSYSSSLFATIYTQGCGRFDPMRLAYINKYGAFDFFNFDLVSKTTFDVERKGYERNYNGSIYEAGGVVVKNINPVYYTKETQKWKIISDYLNDSQAETLRELYSSPLVYMNLVNDNYINFSWIPVKPTATSYEVKKTAIDKVFNIEMELEFGLINTRQVI
jgi:hypothetical protein